MRAVPKFPDPNLLFAAHLAVACRSLHCHRLLNRGAEQCQKWLCEREKQASLSRSPPDAAVTYLAAAASVPAAFSGHTVTYRTTRKSFLYFQEGLWAPSPFAGWHPAALNTCTSRTAGRRCQTKQDSLSSVYIHRQQPLKKTTP